MEIVKIDKDSPKELQLSILYKLQNLLADLECCYPFFSAWLEKVFHELSESYARKVLLCINGGIFDIVGVAIVKDTQYEKKICTLRVVKAYQNQGIGSALLAQTIEELRTTKPFITVSGVQMSSFGTFLKKRGFIVRDKVKSLYRKGAYEYFFNQSYEHKYALMSIKPVYAHAIERGEKIVEFRKKPFANSVILVYVYSSAPVKRIIGCFHVKGIACDTPENIWRQYSDVGCIDQEKFYKYYKGKSKAYGILIERFEKFESHKDPKDFDESFRAPQSFSYIDNVEQLKWLEDK